MSTSELSTGQSTTYDIAGQKVVLKPLTLGKMKQALKAFDTQEGKDNFDMIVDYLMVNLTNGENAFVTPDWIRDNVTMPIADQIVKDSRIINGLSDFFTNKVSSPQETPAPREVRPLTETTPTPSA